MSGAEFLSWASVVTLVMLTLAFLICTVRIAIGPTLPDRILALDVMVSIGIGYIAVVALKTGFTLYLDIAIALGLIGFLGTVAFARFVLQRGNSAENAKTDRGVHK